MTDEALTARLDGIEKALTSGGDRERPMAFREAACYLNCSPSYLYKLTHRRLVPCFKPMGKKLFFKRADLEAFLLQNPVKTKKTIDAQAAGRVALKQRRGAAA